MEQTRFVELKNGMHLIRQKDMALSAKVDSKAINDESELTYSSSNYKKLKVEDLPIYRKWICGDMITYYRGRIIDGRLICDKIHIGNNEISYGTLTLNSVMNDNKLSNETEFNNAICKLITYLEK
jgi:hypothetical protein|tara:strand:+ start:7351 stop:7725 length:375 start_codon:yes stop_codon:yes gene_type:complete